MKISHFCIDRPVFASVLSIVITLAGGVALYNLPIAQYPQIAPVEISVTATYPGASAEVAAQNVASPIEQHVNGADKLMYMSSASSSTGVMTLSVYFDIDANPSLAQVEVQNRVNLALPLLPASVQAQGVAVKKQSAAMMMVVSIYSPDDRYQPVYVSNYASIFILDAIKRIPGAGQATIMGTPDYAMRVWLKPDRMAALGITARDVQLAVAQQNEQYAVGSIGQSPTDRPVEQSFSITTKSRLTTPDEFDNIIIRAASEGAAIVRLKDVGYTELGQRNYSLRTTRQGKPATVLVVYQQPGANALDVARGVRETLEEMKKSFPPGIEYEITMDTTEFTRASIQSVIYTFFEALALVVVVVFLFLQNLRATLIPILAVPISVIGAASGMIALGFSLNMLTMFGMILTIGIVVDDAIVVVEAVEHNMSRFGLSARDAAKKSMDEVGGALIAIVLVLCAVFIPVAFIPGVTGQLYKQFAITIAISVAISGVVALTLSPALAALLLKPRTGEKRGFFKWFDAWFARMTEGYIRSVQMVIKRFAVALMLFIGMIALSFVLLKQVPGSFLPPEDQGVVLGAVLMPDASGLDRTAAVSRHATDYFMNHPAARSIVVLDGFSLLDGQMKSNAATFFVGLKDFEERYAGDNAETQSAPALMKDAAGEVREHRRRHHSAHQSALYSGAGHDWGDGTLYPEQGRQRQPADCAGDRGVFGAGQDTARTDQHYLDLQRRCASAAARRGPGEGRDTGHCGGGCIQHHADNVRLLVRVAIRQVQPPLPGDHPGRTGFPPDSQGYRLPLCPQPEREHGSDQRGSDYPFRQGTGCGDAFQQLHGGKSDSGGCDRIQFR